MQVGLELFYLSSFICSSRECLEVGVGTSRSVTPVSMLHRTALAQRVCLAPGRSLRGVRSWFHLGPHSSMPTAALNSSVWEPSPSVGCWARGAWQGSRERALVGGSSSTARHRLVLCSIPGYFWKTKVFVTQFALWVHIRIRPVEVSVGVGAGGRPCFRYREAVRQAPGLLTSFLPSAQQGGQARAGLRRSGGDTDEEKRAARSALP